MAIDFTFPQEVDDARLLVRKFKRRVMSGEPPFMN